MSMCARRARPRVAAAALLFCLAAGPAGAEPEDGDDNWGMRAAKTATYQAVSSFNDFLYGALVGGGIAAGGMLAATSLVTEPIVHFLHETAWRSAAPPEDAAARVATKTATYAAANVGRIFATGLVVTGSPLLAAGLAAFNMVGDSLTYSANESLWLRFGPAGADAAAGPAP